MSSISGVSNTSNAYQTSTQNSPWQAFKDFQAIGSALQSGDLSTAQSALTTFQQLLPNNPQVSTNQPFSKNSPANTDFQSLTSALQSGDLSGAQKAFASLQTDLKAAHKSHHHHHHGTNAAPPSDSTNATTGSAQNAQAGLLNAVA